MEKKEFHIGDILSITTGRLVSLQHMDGIYDILNYMTGDNLFTHQLIRGAKECQPELLKQHPQLKDVDASNVNKENLRSWLDEQIAKFGEYLPVTPLPAGTHEFRNPLIEGMEMMPHAETIVVVHE